MKKEFNNENRIQKGIRSWKNKYNKFCVIQLYYTADSDKDPSTLKGNRWYTQARPIMSKDDWEQEMEIDFSKSKFFRQKVLNYIIRLNCLFKKTLNRLLGRNAYFNKEFKDKNWIQ
jgi:hypothetical protein